MSISGDPIVTLKDVYHDVQEIRTSVGRLESIVSIAVEARQDHERRLRSLERWAYGIPPALIGSVAAAVIALVKQ